MLFNFRFDQQSTATILTRLRDEHEMSQGWGGGEVNLDVTRPDFVQACFERYRQDGMISTRIPSNLLRMRSFKDGDLIATPHLPERGKVSIHVVDGDFPACYRYDPADDDHLNHRIRVKRSYGLDGNISIYNSALSASYAKLQWLRLPVLPVPEYEEAFQTVIRELDREPEKTFAGRAVEDQHKKPCRRRETGRLHETPIPMPTDLILSTPSQRNEIGPLAEIADPSPRQDRHPSNPA
jgi:hypothetical protein